MSLLARTVEISAGFAEIAENVQYQFVAILDIQFTEQSAQVCPDSGDRNIQFKSDLPIGQAFKETSYDIDLPR